MRVAMIGLRAPEEGLGGIESALQALAPRLATRGVEVTLFCRRGYASRVGAIAPGVDVVALPAPRWRGLETMAYTTLATPLALAGRFDVLHFHAMGPAALSVVPWALGRPAVATLHGLDWARSKWGPVARTVLRFGERAALRFPQRTIVVSRDLLERCERIRPGQAVHIPNGVDVPGRLVDGPAPLPVEPGGFFLALGRRVPEKGLLTLLDAFARLSTRRRLVLAGPGGDSPDLDAALGARAARDPRVIVAGAVRGREKDWLLSQAFGFVLPSTVEGHPLALLEAMAYARPSVVSDLPVLREMAGNGAARRAVVFPAGSTEGLAQALDGLERRPREATEMGERGRALVLAEYGWDGVAARTVRVLEQAAGG